MRYARALLWDTAAGPDPVAVAHRQRRPTRPTTPAAAGTWPASCAASSPARGRARRSTRASAPARGWRFERVVARPARAAAAIDGATLNDAVLRSSREHSALGRAPPRALGDVRCRIPVSLHDEGDDAATGTRTSPSRSRCASATPRGGCAPSTRPPRCARPSTTRRRWTTCPRARRRRRAWSASACSSRKPPPVRGRGLELPGPRWHADRPRAPVGGALLGRRDRRAPRPPGRGRVARGRLFFGSAPIRAGREGSRSWPRAWRPRRPRWSRRPAARWLLR